jgi:transposase
VGRESAQGYSVTLLLYHRSEGNQEEGAGECGAILYTVIESCRRRGINPYGYLKDVLTRLPKMTNHQIPEVTPSAWAKTHLHLQCQAAS